MWLKSKRKKKTLLKGILKDLNEKKFQFYACTVCKQKDENNPKNMQQKQIKRVEYKTTTIMNGPRPDL